MRNDLYDHEDLATGLIACLSPLNFHDLQRAVGKHHAVAIRDDARVFLDGAAQATTIFHIPVAQFLAATPDGRPFGTKSEDRRHALRLVCSHASADGHISYGAVELNLIEALLELIANGLMTAEQAEATLLAAHIVQEGVDA